MPLMRFRPYINNTSIFSIGRVIWIGLMYRKGAQLMYLRNLFTVILSRFKALQLPSRAAYEICLE